MNNPHSFSLSPAVAVLLLTGCMSADEADAYEMLELSCAEALSQLAIVLPLPLLLLGQAFLPALRRWYARLLRRGLEFVGVKRLLVARAQLLALYVAWLGASAGALLLSMIPSFFEDYYVPALGLGASSSVGIDCFVLGLFLSTVSVFAATLWLFMSWWKPSRGLQLSKRARVILIIVVILFALCVSCQNPARLPRPPADYLLSGYGLQHPGSAVPTAEELAELFYEKRPELRGQALVIQYRMGSIGFLNSEGKAESHPVCRVHINTLAFHERRLASKRLLGGGSLIALFDVASGECLHSLLSK